MSGYNGIWATDNKIIYSDKAINVRMFREGNINPYLILPPQAGHHSCIADYQNNKSLVQKLLQEDDCGVYCIEWKPCTFERRNEGINDLILQTQAAFKSISSEQVQIIGLCQGGWVSAIFTSLFQESVSKLILAAAPIDFTVDGGKIQRLCQLLPMQFYRNLIIFGGGLLRGKYMLWGFKNLNWYDRYIGDYVKFYLNQDDPKFMARYKYFKEWYEHTQDLAGGWYLEAVEKLFKHNDLIKEKLIVLDRKVLLSNITCPVALLAAENDDITLIRQLFNMTHFVSSKRILFKTIKKCGHIGAFIKNSALNNEWVQAIKF